MKRVVAAIAFSMGVICGGCASEHRMRTGSGEAKVTVCRECYDQAVSVWTRSSTGYGGKIWRHVPSERVRVEHQCDSCKSTMVVHTDDGRWTLKCPTCAPEGIPCDKCMPGDVHSTSSK